MNRGLDLIGRQIGVYRIEELIGAGGYSRVYRALDRTVGRMAAIKVLLPGSHDVEYSERVIQRFEREARIVANLRDPHSVLLYEYGQTDDGLLYLIFEYIEGHTLEEIRHQQFALPALRVVKILEQILLSLEEAHAFGLIHRDIKPANIMIFEHIGRTDQVKLLDFGVGKAIGTHREAKAITQAGVLVGTPRYMAPEQWSSDGDISPRTDIYSLGLVTYELLTGTRAIRATEPVHIMKAHLDKTPFILPKTLDIPSGLRQVVNTMLKKDPVERYQCVTEVLGDLRRLKPLGSESNTMMLDEERLRSLKEAENLGRDAPAKIPTCDAKKRTRDAEHVDNTATINAAPKPTQSGVRRPKRLDNSQSPQNVGRRCPKTIRLDPEAQHTLAGRRPGTAKRPAQRPPPSSTLTKEDISSKAQMQTPRLLLASLLGTALVVGGYSLVTGLSSTAQTPAIQDRAVPHALEQNSPAPEQTQMASSSSTDTRLNTPHTRPTSIFATTQEDSSTSAPFPTSLYPPTLTAHTLNAFSPSRSKQVNNNNNNKRQGAKQQKGPASPAKTATKKTHSKPPARTSKPAKEPTLKIWGID